MNNFEDNDVKVAGLHIQKSRMPLKDEECISEELDRVRKSGQTDRARTLGVVMAQTFSNSKGEFTFGQDTDETEDIKRERKVLLAFSVAYSFDKFTVSSIVSRTALNTFYDTLKRLDSELYEDLNLTGAFSFYYLAVRRGGDIEHAVGRTFAMLCSKDGDAITAELGEALFCHFCGIVREKIIHLGLDNLAIDYKTE